MDRYPEYRFMATSAQHFQWLEQLYPKVFQRLQEKIRKGNFGKFPIRHGQRDPLIRR